VTALPTRAGSLPRASDGALAMLISLSALIFIVNFVTPFPDALGSGVDSRTLMGLAGRVLVAAVLVERLVEFGLRQRRPADGLSGEEGDRAAFLGLCLVGLLAALLGVRALDTLLGGEAVASLTAGRRALLVWTDLVISTGIIVGVADTLRGLIRSAARRARSVMA
jgi:hypothetical protein